MMCMTFMVFILVILARTLVSNHDNNIIQELLPSNLIKCWSLMHTMRLYIISVDNYSMGRGTKGVGFRVASSPQGVHQSLFQV